MKKSQLSMMLMCVLCIAGPMMSSEAIFQVQDTAASPGQSQVCVPVAAMFPIAVQGFSMALQHDLGNAGTVAGVSVEETIAFEAEYVSCLADNEAGTVVIGLLMEAAPPNNNRMLPALPAPETVLHISLSLSEQAAGGDYLFSFVTEGLPSGEAWIKNRFAAGNESYAVSTLEAGVLSVNGPPPGGVPQFIRGDANQDLVIDITDPIFLLNSLYGDQKGVRPPCIDACDVNDSGMVDLSDAVYLLIFLFRDGSAPPLPGTRLGIDWTPDPFGCDRPAGGYKTDLWPSS